MVTVNTHSQGNTGLAKFWKVREGFQKRYIQAEIQKGRYLVNKGVEEWCPLQVECSLRTSKGLKRREHGSLSPSILILASRPFILPPLRPSLCHLSLCSTLNAALSHTNHLEFPMRASSSPVLTVPIVWHNVETYLACLPIFPSLDISSQNPMDMVGLTNQFVPAIPQLCPQLIGLEKGTRIRQS